MNRRLVPAARFLLGAYLDGTAVWLSLLAGGRGGGPAFAVAAALATGALKAWLLEPAAEFLGLERRPARRFGAAREFALSAAAYAAILASANAAGLRAVADPVGLGLAVEGAYSLLRFMGGAAARASSGVRRRIASRIARRADIPGG